jgi:hypothetical protein
MVAGLVIALDSREPHLRAQVHPRVSTLAVGGSRRKAAQSGGAGRANLDSLPAAPRLAELHRPTQAVIRAGNGGLAS